MGYRSDVGIALGFESKGDCDSFIMAYKLKEPEFWNNVVSPHWLRPDSQVLTASYYCVKWHSSYDDVKKILEMLEWAETVYKANHRIVRIGEDLDDTEIEEDSDIVIHGLYLDEYVDVERRLSYDDNAKSIDHVEVEEYDNFMEDPYLDEHIYPKNQVFHDDQAEKVDSK